MYQAIPAPIPSFRRKLESGAFAAALSSVAVFTSKIGAETAPSSSGIAPVGICPHALAPPPPIPTHSN